MHTPQGPQEDPIEWNYEFKYDEYLANKKERS